MCKKLCLLNNYLFLFYYGLIFEIIYLVNKKIEEVDNIIDFKLVAHIGEIQLIIVAEAEDMAHMFITKLESYITMKKSDIEIDAKLQNISVFDPSSNTIYRHVSIENNAIILFIIIELIKIIYFSRIKIIHVAENDEALKLKMIMYNEQYLVDYDSPEIYMSISSGCIKCVFLNCFITKLLVSICISKYFNLYLKL